MVMFDYDVIVSKFQTVWEKTDQLCVFVTSRLDSCNSLLISCPNCFIWVPVILKVFAFCPLAFDKDLFYSKKKIRKVEQEGEHSLSQLSLCGIPVWIHPSF